MGCLLPLVLEFDCKEISNASGPTAQDLADPASMAPPIHITVCICTYQRPELLKELLDSLTRQETTGAFSFSIVVADNDSMESARPVVHGRAGTTKIPIQYCVEPQQGIALARNKAVSAVSGEYAAFIDDDEVASRRWLANLLDSCEKYGCAGVLGPVIPRFEDGAPSWVTKSGFFDRPSYATGYRLTWPQTRTGNVLIRAAVLRECEGPFRPEFRTGEDQDFFARLMDKGHRFVWCQEAPVYEVVSASRWTARYLLRRSLFRGSQSVQDKDFGARQVVTSLVAVPAYLIALLPSAVLGRHQFMRHLTKLCYHLGRLIGVSGVEPIKDQYVTN